MIFYLIVIYLLIIFIEVPSLLKKNLYAELKAFSILFIIGLYMGLAYSYQWPLTAPFKVLITYMGR